jgi:pyrroloquinoline-quinone synthase
MKNTQFSQEIDTRIAKYDLLCHPFYKAWSMGELTRNDIRDYACDYYHHVQAFPEYLDQLQNRLPDGEVREMVRQNKEDEEAPQARSHADLWLDFAEGMGADRAAAQVHKPLTEINALVETFNTIAKTGSTAEALAAFYAYESQIPRVAAEKEVGLKQRYGADDRTAYYFTLHKAYDIQHSATWLELLNREVGDDVQAQQAALDSAEKAAKALWQALDGVERKRLCSTSRN